MRLLAEDVEVDGALAVDARRGVGLLLALDELPQVAQRQRQAVEQRRLARVGKAQGGGQLQRIVLARMVATGAITPEQQAAAKAEVLLARLTMRAPVAAQVLRVNLREGEYAQAGPTATPLMMLGNTSLHLLVLLALARLLRENGPALDAAVYGDASQRAAFSQLFWSGSPVVPAGGAATSTASGCRCSVKWVNTWRKPASGVTRRTASP